MKKTMIAAGWMALCLGAASASQAAGKKADEIDVSRIAPGLPAGSFFIAQSTVPPPPPCTQPAAPSNLSATAVTCHQVNLTWTNNAADADSLRVLRSEAGGGQVLLATVPANVA